jgi:hypothetical protein
LNKTSAAGLLIALAGPPIGFAPAADMPFGVLMTVFYLWRRDLLANMLAHGTGLVVAMLTVVP